MAAQITALPTPPTRQDPTNFNDRADAFLAALPGFQSEANALSTEVNTRADNVQASDLAVLAATNITKWVSGTTYAQGAVVWSPVNGLGYRRITASDSGTTDPSSDSTNYRQVNGTGNVSTDVSGNLGLGVTPSAWGSFVPRALQLPKGVALASQSNANAGHLVTNAFYDGAWKYVETAPASSFVVNNTGSSGFAWLTAPSGTAGNTISFTQAMTLDASGNLLVGTTTPRNSARITVDGTNDNGSKISLYRSDTGQNLLVGSNYIGTFSNSALEVYTNGTERARIDSSGNLLVGTTSAGSTATNSVTLERGGSYAYMLVNHSATASGEKYAYFNYNGSTIGSITQSGTTAVAYNTSSDYRLKHSIVPMQNALQRVAALKPVTYKWNVDGSDGEGFIAHELAEVCPSAVTGEKDAVDANGNPLHQGIDTSFLVATLVAAIQEQQITITNLTSRIEALESALPK